ncbi:deoxyribodipyrimidine photolyase [Salmonella enterica subsp. enterica]|uniref:Deoxyribodipyrimidine photolyase n=1 Tax=Salmonella enterica I TaxID=59201 RepID=A0A379VVT7_SALET|nr:deoxyribodipyrimidine photolyase [Salmonella enterica subsp. enterica]
MRSGPEDRVSGALSTPLTPVSLNYPQQAFDAALFPVEENAVIAQLRQFCAQGADGYESRRDFPAVDGTSRLSASLATGGLSPRQCLHRLLAEQPQALDGGPGSVWLNELIWREFLPSFNDLVSGIMQTPAVYPLDQNASRWQENSHYFQAMAERRNRLSHCRCGDAPA